MPSNGRNPLVSRNAEDPLHGNVAPQASAGENPRSVEKVSDPRATQRDVAAYIEHLTADLRAMSRSVDLDSLAYFLEMARLEASTQVERLGRSVDRGDHPQET